MAVMPDGLDDFGSFAMDSFSCYENALSISVYTFYTVNSTYYKKISQFWFGKTGVEQLVVPTHKRLPQHRLHQQLRLFLAFDDLRFQGVDGGHEAVDTGDDGLLFGEGGGEGLQ